MASLQGKLHETPLSKKTRFGILAELWRELSTTSSDIEPYFEYYERQCHHALHERGQHILIHNHEHIAKIAGEMEADCSRESIKENLTRLFTSTDRTDEEEVLNNSVDLTARLYLMVNIGSSKSTITGGTKLLWSTGTIKKQLASYFNETPVLSDKDIRFQKKFTGANLERIAGIKIHWTSNLADHLRMVDDDNKLVAIFHHATFLKHQPNTLYPPGLAEETLRPLALLFPKDDKYTKKWLGSLPSTLYVDRQLNRCGQLRLKDRQIETYRFWHDRLIILKQAF